MHYEVGLLNLPPIHKKNLYGKISDKLRQVEKQVRGRAKGAFVVPEVGGYFLKICLSISIL